MINPTEPEVTINGVKLTFAQSMTLRVAMCSFRSEMIEEGLGNDEHGRRMAKSYAEKAEEIIAAMFLNLNKEI
jgi:hypothetical protein